MQVLTLTLNPAQPGAPRPQRLDERLKLTDEAVGLDEARVMQAARGLGWAKLDYESQRESPTLLKFGETRTLR